MLRSNKNEQVAISWPSWPGTLRIEQCCLSSLFVVPLLPQRRKRSSKEGNHLAISFQGGNEVTKRLLVGQHLRRPVQLNKLYPLLLTLVYKGFCDRGAMKKRKQESYGQKLAPVG